jgi:hypothetical protein
MLAALPLVVAALPTALLSGVRNAPIHFALGFPFLLAAGLVWWLAWREQYALAIAAIAITVVGAMIYVKVRTFPELDRTVSVRGFWREHGIEIDQACVARVRRQWIYGLNYYAGHPLSDCAPGDMRSRVVEQAGSLMIQG